MNNSAVINGPAFKWELEEGKPEIAQTVHGVRLACPFFLSGKKMRKAYLAALKYAQQTAPTVRIVRAA